MSNIIQDIENEVLKPAPTLLEQLKIMSLQIRDKASQRVVFTPPIIARNGQSIIRRGTLVGVQGRFGSHKSRFSEVLASLVIAKTERSTCHLGYEKNQLERIALAFIDTERTTKEELPVIIQSIRKNAGYEAFTEVPNFFYTSIKTIERKNRLSAVKEYLQDIRKQTDLHIYCVLDVLTDCVSDFNDAKDSLELCDFLNSLCENHNATILGVIHENPGSEKARGHLGTELANKASTFFQIGFIRDKSGNDTDIIKLRYLKVRSIKRPESIFLTYSQEAEGLILAPSEMMDSLTASNRIYDTNEIAEFLEDFLTDIPTTKKDLIEHLKSKTELSQNPIVERLSEIEKKGRNLILHDSNGAECFLQVNRANGKTTTYQLTTIETPKTDD